MAKAKQKLDRAEWAKLAQDVQAMYTERDGSYYLDTEEAEGLRSALDRKSGELVELKRKMDALAAVDPDEYSRLKAAADQAARDKELEKGNFEKLLTQDREAHAKALAAKDAAASALRAQLESSLVDGELTRSIAKYPGAKQTPLLLGAKRFTKLMEINGLQRAVVVDAKGEPRLKAGAKTADDYMTPDDLVTEMRNDKEWAGNFPASNVATPRSLTTVGAQPQSRATRDMAEQIGQRIAAGDKRVS